MKTTVDIATEPDETRILVLYKGEKVVDVITVTKPEDTKAWFKWLDECRRTAENAGYRIYNWGDVEPTSMLNALERLKEL